MTWISVKEYAALTGKSRQAVLKAIKNGKLQARQVPGSGARGTVYEILTDNLTTPDNLTTTAPIETAIKESLIAEQAISKEEPQPIPKRSAVIEYVPYHKMGEAQLYALLLQEIDRRLREAESRTQEWKQITEEYNQGKLVPELRKLKGKRSERGLRFWYQKWEDNEQDMFQLIHKNTAQIRGRKVTQFEQDYLLNLLLRNSKISIGSAITDLKDEARECGFESPSSRATLKRWCNDWAAEHPAVWGQAWKGDKWVHDNIIPSIKRDMSGIKFGDVLIADGHVVANDIINPATGKACRLTLIMFYDWASRYPVGASLAYTEDSVHILTALRNAILQLGFIPRAVYLDNGKAFKSKLFHEKADEHDLEKELAGIFPRLGIYAHFATPYNGRSKAIERFFKTMQEEWERFMSSFRGAKISDKPSHLMRNEKWARKMFAGKPMEYDEALNMAYDWVRNKYGNRMHSALNGKTPYEVFSESERPADRVIDEHELDILMLKAERKKVRKDGVMLMGNMYWAKELVDYVLQPVVIRYDYCDLNSILVYDMRSRLICQAELVESVHGFAVLSDNPLAYHKVKAKITEQRQMAGLIRKVTKMKMKASKDGVERELAKHQEIIDARRAAIKEHNPLFKSPPSMPKIEKRLDVNDEVAELERIAERHEEPVPVAAETVQEESPAAAAKEDSVTILEDLLKEDNAELAETVSFAEMQRIIGIKQ